MVEQRCLTPGVQQHIVGYVAEGNYPEFATRLAGIARPTSGLGLATGCGCGSGLRERDFDYDAEGLVEMSDREVSFCVQTQQPCHITF